MKIDGLICVFYLIRQSADSFEVIIFEPILFKSHYFEHSLCLSSNDDAGINSEEFAGRIDLIKLIPIAIAKLRGQENTFIQKNVGPKE